MRVLIAVLIFVALVLAVGDVSNSTNAQDIRLLGFGDGLRHLIVQLQSEDAARFLDRTDAGPSAAALRWIFASPASLVLLSLATVLWLVRWGYRRSVIAPKQHRADAVDSAKPAIDLAQGSTSRLRPDQAPPAGSASQQLPDQSGSKRLRTVVEAPAAPAQSTLLVATTDRDFLPASLEILLTPASPVASTLLLTICGAFAAGLAWSYFSYIDIHAVAVGKIQPSGRSKVVQPIEAGKVVAIRVENGSTVNAGDVLLELDPTETGADREALARDLEAANAEAARRFVAINVAGGDELRPRPIAFDAGVSEQVRRRETDVLSADLAQLRSVIANLKAQLDEKQATKQRLSASIEARQKLIALSKERVEMRREIDSRGAGSRAMIIEALQQYETHVTTDEGERGQLIETQAAVISIQRKHEETLTQFIADQTQKLAEIERKRDRLVQELVKAQSKSDRTQLKAPIAGTVQQLNVTTVGQVVASGQSLLTVVPLDGPLEIEAMITNKDIGFVEVGQPAVIKVEAFQFTRYGTIGATVAKVSRDAVDERTSTGLSDAANATKPQGASPAQGSQTGNLVFPMTLNLERRTIRVDTKDIALMPGMSVMVEVKTGQRRAIDYILSPLREITAQAAHER